MKRKNITFRLDEDFIPLWKHHVEAHGYDTQQDAGKEAFDMHLEYIMSGKNPMYKVNELLDTDDTEVARAHFRAALTELFNSQFGDTILPIAMNREHDKPQDTTRVKEVKLWHMLSFIFVIYCFIVGVSQMFDGLIFLMSMLLRLFGV